jgi:alpha-L-rhamnosidase
LVNPQGLDLTPDFSWQMVSNRIGAKQISYRIRVCLKGTTSPVWDSGYVASAASTNIAYGGFALQAKTDYVWTVDAITDKGDVLTQSAAFSTGLMNTTLAAFNDGTHVAQWIGHNDYSLQADSLYNFNSTYHFIPGETSAKKFGFIYGANDLRLNHKAYNPFGVASENYLKVEIDLTALTADGGGKIRVLRKGYGTAEATEEKVVTNGSGTSLVTGEYSIPKEVLSTATLGTDHVFDMIQDFAEISSITIDGTEILPEVESTGWGGAVTKSIQKLIVNPTGAISDTMGFPYLNNIGFYAADGTMTFTNYKLTNLRAEDQVLFGNNVGATLKIFSGLSGFKVDETKDTIEVTSAQGYADPSYGGATYLRNGFALDQEVQSAKLYVTARGVFDYFINGNKVKPTNVSYTDKEGTVYDEDYLNPGNSNYTSSMTYSTYDVTSYLAQGDNAQGAVVSSGWWSDNQTFEGTRHNYYGDRPGLLSLLEVTLKDNSVKKVVTDTTHWKVSNAGPIVYSSLFNGERYDSAKETAFQGWNKKSFDDSAWQTPAVVTAKDSANENPSLLGSYDYPVHVHEVLDGTYLEKKTLGDKTVYIYDMKANMTGIPEVRFPALKKGAKIFIRVSEVRYPDITKDGNKVYGDLTGMLMRENYRTALNYYTYVARGDGQAETFLPSLTFTGYQYLDISFLDDSYTESEQEALINQTSVKGRVLTSLPGIDSTYESSNDLTNQLFDNCVRSALGNHVSIPTDCPQRDERMGWNGDASIFANAAPYLSNMNEMYRNWARMLMEAQGADGNYGGFAPNFGTNIGFFGLTWGGVGVSIAYNVFRQTGDTGIVSDLWDSMKKFLDNLMANHPANTSYMTSKTGFLGDHLAKDGTTDATLMDNVVFAHYLEEFCYMANYTRKTEDYKTYHDYLENWKIEFNTKCVKEDGTIQSLTGKEMTSQTSYALPLAYGFVDDSKLSNVMAKYKETIAKENDTITTGFVGTAAVLDALSNYGEDETAYALFIQTEYASWLYPVTQGATSIWERWNSLTEDGFANGNGMNSFNHYSYGVVSRWMMETQLGIATGDEPGFQKFVLAPTLGGDFTFAKGTYQSNLGLIASGWTASDNALTSYDCVVPANTEATLYLPVTAAQAKDMALSAGVTLIGETTYKGKETVAYTLVSGGYHFEVKDGHLTMSITSDYRADK